MKTIYKYPIPIQSEFEIEMPEGAQILSVQTQYGVPCLWALVDTVKPMEKRGFYLIGTGNRIDVELNHFIATFQIENGTFVFHLFSKFTK